MRRADGCGKKGESEMRVFEVRTLRQQNEAVFMQSNKKTQKHKNNLKTTDNGATQLYSTCPRIIALRHAKSFQDDPERAVLFSIVSLPCM